MAAHGAWVYVPVDAHQAVTTDDLGGAVLAFDLHVRFILKTNVTQPASILSSDGPAGYNGHILSVVLWVPGVLVYEWFLVVEPLGTTTASAAIPLWRIQMFLQPVNDIL